MQFNFNKTAQAFGESLKENDKEMSYKDLFRIAYIQAKQIDKRDITPEENFDAYLIIESIVRSKEPIKLLSKEVTLLKQIAGSGLPNLGAAVCWQFLDNPEKEEDKNG